MNLSDAQYASKQLALLESTFRVAIKKDWGDETGSWQDGVWSREDLDRLHNTLVCFGECIGGVDKVGECTGGVAVFREDLGKHGGGIVGRSIVNDNHLVGDGVGHCSDRTEAIKSKKAFVENWDND